MLTFVDDFPCKVWFYFVRQKIRCLPHSIISRPFVENRAGKNIKNLGLIKVLNFLSSISTSHALLVTLVGTKPLGPAIHNEGVQR